MHWLDINYLSAYTVRTVFFFCLHLIHIIFFNLTSWAYRDQKGSRRRNRWQTHCGGPFGQSHHGARAPLGWTSASAPREYCGTRSHPSRPAHEERYGDKLLSRVRVCSESHTWYLHRGSLRHSKWYASAQTTLAAPKGSVKNEKDTLMYLEHTGDICAQTGVEGDKSVQAGQRVGKN